MSTYEQVNMDRTSVNNRIAGFIGGISTRFAQYRTYRRTLDELNALTDRELSDMGISRHNLRSIAYRAAYDG